MSRLELAKVAAEVVSREELVELAQLERNYVVQAKDLATLKGLLDVARLVLAGKVLGEAAKDLKLMDPEHVEKVISTRFERGLWKAGRRAPPFVFLEVSHGRYPAWKKLYIGELGEAAAEKISAETPTNYSYRVDVAV